MVKQNQKKKKKKALTSPTMSSNSRSLSSSPPAENEQKSLFRDVCFMRLGETRNAECSTDATRRTGSGEERLKLQKGRLVAWIKGDDE